MTRLSRWVAGAVLACGALSTAALPARADDHASSSEGTGRYAGMDCELHVWSIGRPNFVPKSNAFVKYTPPTEEQLADPHSTVNIFSMPKRIMALGEDELKLLFPGANSVTIIRHAEMIDKDVTPLKSFKGKIAESDASCYGDLVMRGLVGIHPNPNAPYVQYGVVGGLVADLLAGGNRLVVDFWFQQWPGGKKDKPLVVKRKNDTPLAHVRPASPDMLAAVSDAADANLAIFAETVAKKRR